jgi:flagellar biosynthesis/type III secretory pathway ATPase
LEFEVDELPDAVNLNTPFGVYSTSYDVKDGHLVFKRTLSQPGITVPVEQYASVRRFFEQIRAAEQAPVVLARK